MEQAGLEAERDQLLAEKENWSKTATATTTDATGGAPAPSNWEAEKAQLIKARDEALEKLKVGFVLYGLHSSKTLLGCYRRSSKGDK